MAELLKITDLLIHFHNAAPDFRIAHRPQRNCKKHIRTQGVICLSQLCGSIRRTVQAIAQSSAVGPVKVFYD